MTIGYITFTTGIIIPTNVTEKVNVINLQQTHVQVFGVKRVSKKA